MVFETEADLRNKGKAKTPDVLLLIPMMTKYSLRSITGKIVCEDVVASNINWIDSKAIFADEITFNENKVEQFQGYVNRYGRGMVIYWHGFVDSVVSDITNDNESIVVVDHFPDEWRFPTGELATVDHVPSFMTRSIHDMDTNSDGLVSSVSGVVHPIPTNRMLFDD